MPGEDEDGKRRKNGFELPWHYLQIATWILFPVVLIHYFAYLMPLLWSNIADRVIVTLVFCICCFTALLGGYLTCVIDPADDMILKADEDQTPPPSGLCACFHNISAAVASNESKDDEIYCYVCESNVHESSKHCRYCQKCIVRFDHVRNLVLCDWIQLV